MQRRHIARALAACLLLPGCFLRHTRDEASFPALADAILAVPEEEGASVSAFVVDAATGARLYGRRENARALPASTLKLASTAAALAALGSDFRFRTRVLLEGAIDGDLAAGELVVEASGDPSLGSWRWPETGDVAVCDRIATALASRGVKRWRGSMRIRGGEESPDAPLGPGWAWDDSAYDYSAVPTPFVFRENVVDFRILRAASASCDAPAVVTIEPAGAPLAAELRFGLLDSGSALACVRERGSARAKCTWRYASGTCPREARAKLSVDDPATLFATCLAGALGRAGIVQVPHLPEPETPVPVEPTVVAELESPPLSELVRVTNKESLNLYAERLALRFTQEKQGFESFEALRKAMEVELASRGVDVRGMVAVDGSGLSRYNLASSAALVKVLQTSLVAPYSQAILDSLPIVGVDGTLAKRGLSDAVKGRVRAKTGSMTGQRAWVGVAERPSDKAHPRVVFALMIGNQSSPTMSANEVFDRFVEAIVGAGME